MKNKNKNRYNDTNHRGHEEDVQDIDRGGLRKAKRKTRRRSEKQYLRDICDAYNDDNKNTDRL